MFPPAPTKPCGHWLWASLLSSTGIPYPGTEVAISGAGRVANKSWAMWKLLQTRGMDEIGSGSSVPPFSYQNVLSCPPSGSSFPFLDAVWLMTLHTAPSVLRYSREGSESYLLALPHATRYSLHAQRRKNEMFCP